MPHPRFAGDISTWRAASGTASANWRWASCCTDGLVSEVVDSVSELAAGCLCWPPLACCDCCSLLPLPPAASACCLCLLPLVAASGCCSRLTPRQVLGPMPTHDFSLTFSIEAYSIPATDALRVGTWDAATSSISFRVASLREASAAAPYNVRITGYTTDGYCGSFTSVPSRESNA